MDLHKAAAWAQIIYLPAGLYCAYGTFAGLHPNFQMPGINTTLIDISLGAFSLGLFLVIADKTTRLLSRRSRPAQTLFGKAESEELAELRQKLDEKTRAADKRDEIIKVRDETIADLKAKLLLPVHESTRTLSASIFKPILEFAGPEEVVNVASFGGVIPSEAPIHLYTVRIRNNQRDVARTARNVRARIDFVQHDTDGFSVQEAAWIHSRRDDGDKMFIWGTGSVDIVSEEHRNIIIAGSQEIPPGSAQSSYSWSVFVNRDGDTRAYRTLGFGRWKCMISINADLLDPINVEASFNVDAKGAIVNFCS